MSKSMRILITGVTVTALALPSIAAVKRNSKAGSKSPGAVVLKDVLQAEEKGRIGDRVKRLKSARQKQPGLAPLQWQSGRVRLGKAWIEFDGIVTRTDDDKLTQQYLKLRSKTMRNIQGHWKLADWCKRHGMPDRGRAHLTAMLDIAPNHLAARKALGYVRIGANWVRKDDLARRRQDAAVARKSLQTWLPKVKAIRAALVGSNNRRRLKATKRLAAIDTADAADAIELGLGWQSPHLGLIAVDKLGSIKHPHTTRSLARLAVASPWKSVRNAATKQLKQRRLDHFVPQLLAMTRTAIQSRQLLYFGITGSLYYRHSFYQEGPTTRKVVVADYSHHVFNVHNVARISQPRSTIDPNTPAQLLFSDGFDLFGRTNGRARARNDGVRIAGELAARRRLEMEKQNRKILEFNDRVRTVVSETSGMKFGKDPRELWNWWESYSEVWNPGYKNIDRRYYNTRTYQPVYSYVHQMRKSSCLVAGTPVWTERGLVAIDKVRIGDRVLAKDVTTGELAYKPVLKTTVRPAAPLMKLEIGNRTISLTKGHPFWISGRGWLKAKEIKQGMYLHDVTGTTTVRPAGDAKPAKTYNLIVADFHTYFVGEAKVLSHDNTPIEPTSALVPGLVKK